MVEYFVHLDPGHPPPDLVVATAEIPDHLKRVHLAPADLPDLWRLTPPIPDLAAIGDRFIRELNAAILTVPSARAPSERNWLLNPSHADFSQIATLPTEPFHFDPRFFRPRV
jgi:RES domain-containing protein